MLVVNLYKDSLKLYNKDKLIARFRCNYELRNKYIILYKIIVIMCYHFHLFVITLSVKAILHQ